MNEKGFTLIELLAVIVILAFIALISTPIILNIITKVQGKARLETANRVLNSAKIFFEESLLDQVQYPTTGLEFVCDGKQCSATVGNVSEEEGIALLADFTTYSLPFTGTIPSSGSIVIYQDGTILSNNLAIDSKICEYDESKKRFIEC